MSEDEESKSDNGRWIVAVVAALVVYVLSVGPVLALVFKYPDKISWAEKPLVIFYSPLMWVGERSPVPVSDLMSKYVIWCCKIFNAPFPEC